MDKKDLYKKMITAYCGILNMENHFEDMGFGTVGSVLSNDVGDSVFSALLYSLDLELNDEDNLIPKCAGTDDAISYNTMLELTSNLSEPDNPGWDELWNRFHTA